MSEIVENNLIDENNENSLIIDLIKSIKILL